VSAQCPNSGSLYEPTTLDPAELRTLYHNAIAERDRLEAELMRAEKLAALGTLAGGMAHDFNNILTAILAYTGIAQMHANEPLTREALEQVIRAADRAKNIAQQVLDFSASQKRSRAPVNLPALAHEVLALLRPIIPDNIEIVTDVFDSSGTVLGNAAQLHQVILNVCHNAIHALRLRGGQLVLRIAPVTVDEALVREHPGLHCTPHICLSVIDDGHGMDAVTQRRIFEPFFTTKTNGHGLGLAVVQRIVRDHDGVIHVTSQPGEGTVFRIFFPAHEPTFVANPAGADFDL
jgi:two-component system cell cycle sensor histidine kinase/response regulator CckA